MSAVFKGYSPQARAEDALYFSLCQCRNLRLDAERHPPNSGASVNTLVEREGWVSDVKARIFDMRAQRWGLTTLLADMVRSEGIAT